MLRLSQCPPLFVVTEVVHWSGAEQPEVTFTAILFAGGGGCRYASVKVRLPGATCSAHCGRMVMLTNTVCGLSTVGAVPVLLNVTCPL